MLQLAIVQVALSLAAIGLLLLGRSQTRAGVFSKIAAGWVLLIGLAVAGVWLAVPLTSVIVLSILMLTANIVALVRHDPPGNEPTRLGTWLGRLLALAFAGIGIWAAVPAVAGWNKLVGTVDLQFPFREGRYLVVNGGSSARINAHYMTLDPHYHRWVGESFAVDLIRVDGAGFRTRERRLFYVPRDPAAYLTFDTPVIAPCDGTVEEIDSNRPDMQVPRRDREQLGGNFVRLRCGGHVVLLGHFRRNGVIVNAGDRVRVGEPLGRVGNSGNTDEPHLHIHVQTPGTPRAPLAGQPLPVSFDGRFPVRNMIMRADPEQD